MSEATLTISDQARALRNDALGTFELGDRTFEIKDLEYDSYIEFVELARPIIATVADTVEVVNKDGELDLEFNALNIDVDALIKLAGKELPKMAWLCCKQSDPKISIADVKRLGRRPHKMLEVVLLQVKHNKLVNEFADFFPRIAAALTDLMPDAKAVMTPLPVAEPTEQTTE